MAWRDNYRAATFRGVGFFVATADSSHGRRQAVHETAQRDIPYTEDLGRKSREFGITGYLLGKEYDVAREELIKVCEQAGPGVLVHPYRGELTVVCRGLTVSETSDEGGKCTLSMTFLEAGEASYPSAKVDSVNAISAKAEEVTEASKENFVSDFLTKGYPSFVADAATAQIKGLSDFLSSPEFIVSSDIQAVSDYYDKVKSIGADAFSLIQAPFDFADQVVDAVGSIRSAFGGSAFGMLMSLYEQYFPSDDDESGSSGTPSPSSTPSRQQVVKNTAAVSALVRQAAVSEAAVAAVVTQTTESVSSGGTKTTSEPTKYDSYEAAIVVRTELSDRLDEESETTNSDLVYGAVTDLRTAVVRALPDPEQDLPRLATFSPKQTLPSLVVAYQLYGDSSRAEEIVLRNDPRRPGFLIGGQQLEVLANG
jgi:prophage DNA circulation protein